MTGVGNEMQTFIPEAASTLKSKYLQGTKETPFILQSKIKQWESEKGVPRLNEVECEHLSANPSEVLNDNQKLLTVGSGPEPPSQVDRREHLP